MAGDWIPMRIDLTKDPAVIRIAEATGLDAFGVIGRLHHLWSWANAHLVDGNAPGVTDRWVDRELERDGFARAMADVGWLLLKTGGISFPNFDRWNSRGAKARLASNRRVAKHRSGAGNARSVTSALPKPLPEKRREEKREIHHHRLPAVASASPHQSRESSRRPTARSSPGSGPRTRGRSGRRTPGGRLPNSIPTTTP